MRKIIVQEMITVDGFFAGSHNEIDWHVVNAEFNEYAMSVLNNVDTLIFGRVTYDLMASYWPTPTVIKNDPLIAEKMNSLLKIVFSKTLKKVLWNNSKLVSDISANELLKMKQDPGKDMIIYGSGTIVSTLTELNLVDEYRFVVNPVILGKGRSLFNTVQKTRKLKLVTTKTFASGNILLCYEPLA